jgi:integrase
MLELAVIYRAIRGHSDEPAATGELLTLRWSDVDIDAGMVTVRHTLSRSTGTHDMRHACATLRHEDGEKLGVISRTVGHSQIPPTADVYAHLTPAMLERMAARLDRVLTRRPRATGA